MRFQEFVVGSDVNGTSRPFAAAEAEPVGFAVGGEGEDRVAGERAVGLVKIPRGDKALRSGGGGSSSKNDSARPSLPTRITSWPGISRT